MPGLRPTFKPAATARKEFQAMLAKQSAALSSKNPDGMAKLMQNSGARFVRNVADVTPPAMGKADTAAKKLGENAIIADLLKLAVPLQGVRGKAVRDTLNTAEELINLHASAINNVGRVNPSNRKNKLWVSQQTFDKVAKQFLDRVGWLAAGLNAAAEKLGRPLPAWIRRHGNKHGKIDVTVSASGIKITVTQNVPYADGVSGYQRRWDFALNKELRTLASQAKIVMQKLQEKAARSGKR